MNRRFLIGLAFVLASGAGCSDTCAPPKPVVRAKWTPASSVRLLAIAKGRSCPKADDAEDGAWKHGRVFDDIEGRAAPASLRNLCYYHWKPGPKGAAAARDKLPKVGIGRFIDDPIVVAPLEDASIASGFSGTAFVDPSLGLLQDAFFGASGAPPKTPLGPAPGKVTIGVPDTSPFGTDITPGGASQHGFNIAWIAKKMACSAGALCPPDATPGAISMSMELALPQPTPADDPTASALGGTYGATTELASAIHLVTSRFRAARSAITNPEERKKARLVINLSLGWEPDPHGLCEVQRNEDGNAKTKVTQADKDQKAKDGIPVDPAEYVHDAIREAVCSGALVVVAAGNNPSGLTVSGPMCPAQWEKERAPSQKECEALLGKEFDPDDRPQDSAAYDPLVHAVGAVGWDDLPIIGTRPGGIPRLVAPGYRGVAYPGAPLAHTQPFTGTSVSTAAVSGIAAAYWAYHPDKAAWQVMDQIFQKAVQHPNLSQLPDAGFCLENACINWRPRRASLCETLDAPCPEFKAPESKIDDATFLQLKTWIDARKHTTTPKPGQKPDEPSTTLPANMTLAMFVRPQPLSIPCPPCVFSFEEEMLYVSIDPMYPTSGTPLTNMTLKLYATSSDTIPLQTYTDLPLFNGTPIPTNALSADQGVDVAISGANTAASRATLSWTMPDTSIVTQYIYLHD